MKFIGGDIIDLLGALHLPGKLTSGIQVLNPYLNDVAMDTCRQFYSKYYRDSERRTVLFGINPGRLGAGQTGIGFTDPIRLENACGIANPFPKKPELSSEFIYQVVDAMGGPSVFFKKFFISSVCPLGFTKADKNINYYDVPPLQKKVLPFIIQAMDRTCTMNVNRDACVCIGEGTNFKLFSQLNETHRWFSEIVALPHPRFIMQYRRKEVKQFVEKYQAALSRF